jgi:hypothetical protein
MRVGYRKRNDKLKKNFLDPLAKAAYEARRTALQTGVYPDRAFTIPSSRQYYDWDDADIPTGDVVKWLYRKEAQAVLEAFVATIAINGTPEAKQAFGILLQELAGEMFTDVELAKIAVQQEQSTQEKRQVERE